MRKRTVALAGLLAAVVGGPANAILIDIGGVSTDVGDLDRFLAITESLNTVTVGDVNTAVDCGQNGNSSNERVEECWSEESLQALFDGFIDLELDGKTDTVSVSYLDTVGAFPLIDMPNYYVIKNSNGWALFQNLGSLSYGVIDTASSDFDGVKIKLSNQPGTISHVTEFSGGGGNEVSEPGALALLGAGIAAFGFARRRRPRN